MLATGLYKAEFNTRRGRGAGTIFVQDGKLWGGDSSMFYIGRYTEDGDGLSAVINTDIHTKIPGIESVFGVDQLRLTLGGTIKGDSIVMTGRAAQAPTLEFEAVLTKICE
jgi:hypothetical protein